MVSDSHDECGLSKLEVVSGYRSRPDAPASLLMTHLTEAVSSLHILSALCKLWTSV